MDIGERQITDIQYDQYVMQDAIQTVVPLCAYISHHHLDKSSSRLAEQEVLQTPVLACFVPRIASKLYQVHGKVMSFRKYS